MIERVRELLEQFNQDPTQQGIRAELQAAVADESDPEGSIIVFKALAQHSEVAKERAALMRTAAMVAADKLEDYAQAVDLYTQSLEVDSENTVETLGHMRRLMTKLGTWEDFVDVATLEVELLEDAEQKAEIYLQLGRVYEEELDELALAMDSYQKAFSTWSGCISALTRAQKIYEIRGNTEMVAELLRLQLEYTADGDAQLPLWNRLGGLAVDEEEARRCFENALAIDSANTVALDALKAFGDPELNQGVPEDALKFDDAVLVGGEVIPSADDAGEKDGLLPTDEVATAGRALLTSGSSGEQEPLFDADGVQAHSVDVSPSMIEGIDSMTDSVLDAPAPEEQKSLVSETDDPEDSASSVVSGADNIEGQAESELADDTNDGAGEENTKLEATTGDDSESSSTDDEEDPLMDNPSHGQAELAVAGEGATTDQRSEHGDDDTDDAESAELEDGANEPSADDEGPKGKPGTEQALDMETSVSEDHGSLNDASDDSILAAAVEEEEAESAEPESAPEPEPAPEPELELVVSDEERAERILELETLADESEGAARYSALIKAASLARGEEQVRLYLASVREAPAAVESYWRVGSKLDVKATSVQAIIDELDGMIEADFEGCSAPLTAHRMVLFAKHVEESRTVDFKLREMVTKGEDERVVEWQVQRLIETGKWRNAQQILGERAAGDPASARVAALKELAVLAEVRLGDSVKAAEFWRQAYQGDKTDAVARRALISAYESLGKWKEYVDLLRVEVDSLPDDAVDEKISGLRKLVSVIDQHMRQDALLVQLYGKLIELQPGDQELVNLLVNKFESMRRWPDLIKLLESQLAYADPDDGIGIKLRIASIYLDKMRNQAQALTAFEEVLQVEPDSADALNALNTLYEKRRNWAGMIEMRTRLAELEADPDARLKQFKDLAQYASKRIRKPELTRQLWEKVTEYEPDDKDALGQLVIIYEQAGEFDDLIRTIEHLVEHVDESEKQALLLKAGMVLQDRVRDQAGAIEIWQRMLANDPQHRRAADNLKKALIELEDWDELVSFFGGLDRWSELVRILESQVGVQQDTTVRISLLNRCARVYIDELDQSDRGVRALERIVQLDEEQLDASRELAEIYERDENWRKLGAILETVLRHTSDGEEKRRLLRQHAALCESKLRNREGALTGYVQLIAEEPGSEDALTAIVRLAGELNQWPMAREALSQAMAELPSSEVPVDDVAQLRLVLALANILDDQIGDYDEATIRYEEALVIDADSITAMDALETLYTRSGRWYDLLSIMERKITLADVDQRGQLVRKQAVIYEEQLEDLPAAIECYVGLLQEQDDDPEALAALRRLYAETHQSDELQDILRRHLEIALDAEDVNSELEVRLELAGVLLNALGQTEDALSELENILKVQGAHLEARLMLEGLLQDTSFRGRVAQILEPIYRENEDWSGLVNCLEITLQEEDDPERRNALFENIGELQREKSGDLAASFDAYARLFRETPLHSSARIRLTELAELMSRWSELAQLIEEVSSTYGNLSEIIETLQQLAGIYENQLDNVSMAIDVQRRILEHEPDHRAAVNELERLYQQTQEWSELLEIYGRKLEWNDAPETRVPLQLKMANLLEDLLGETQDAIAIYVEIRSAVPEHEGALNALIRLYESEGMWLELAEGLTEKLASTDDSRVAHDLKVRLGEVQHEKLGETESAIELYREVTNADPDHEGARLALEKLLGDSVHRAAAALILEPVYQVKDDWHSLLTVLEVQCESTEEVDAQVALFHRIAQLHEERAESPAEAFISFARAFRADPEHLETHIRLEGLAGKLGAWAELVEIYETQVEQLTDPEILGDVYKRAARILQDKLDSDDRARPHYEAALGQDEADSVAIEALDGIYTRSQSWSDLVALLLRNVDQHHDEPSEQKAILKRIARLFEDMLQDSEQAVESLRTVLELDDRDADAIEGLERLYQNLGRWQDLLEVLRLKLALSEEVEAQKAILRTIGETFEVQLKDPHGAVETYQEILVLDDQDLEILGRMDQLFEALEQWDDQLECMIQQLACVEGDEAKTSLRFRIAHLRDKHLEDGEGAIQGYAEILTTEPQHEQTLHALEQMVRADRFAIEAMEALEPVLRAALDWERLIAAWRDLLSSLLDLEVQTDYRLRIARTYMNELSDAESAFATYGEAFLGDPTVAESLEALEGLAADSGDWPALVALLEEQLTRMPADLVARDLYLRLAQIYDRQIADTEKAVAAYVSVRELEPEHGEALAALDRLYQAQGRWVEMVEILVERIERTDEQDEKLSFFLRLGAVLETAIEDYAQAVSAYREAMIIDAENAEAVEALERILETGYDPVALGEMLEPVYLSQDNFARQAWLAEILLPQVTDIEDRNRALKSLAELHGKKLNDKAAAFRWYGEAYSAYPLDEESRDALWGLAKELETYGELAQVFVQSLEATDDPELRQAISLQLARVYDTHLADAESAEMVLRFVLEQVDANDLEALSALDVILERQQRWPELSEILVRKIDVLYEDEPRSRAILRVASIYLDKLGDTQNALEQYQAALAINPYEKDALRQLVPIYSQMEDWNALYDVYERQSESVDSSDEKADIFVAMAKLAGDALSRPDEAVETWNKVLELRGENLEALHYLEILYEFQESWRDLVDVCERQASLLEHDVEREIELYSKLGQVWGENLNRERNALENWNRVLELDANSERALWALRDLYGHVDEHKEIVEINLRLLEMLPGDDERRGDLYRQMGELYAEALDQPNQAADAWTQLLQIMPSDAQALDALEDIYTRQENWLGCVDVIQSKARFVSDEFEKVSLYFQLAEVAAEKCGDANLTAQAHVQILELQPDNIDAYEALESHYQSAELWDDLVALYLNRLEHASDSEEQYELYLQTSRIFEEKQGNVENALVVLTQAFEQNRDDERMGDELERLAALEGLWAPFIDTYQRVIESMGQDIYTVPMRLRVARVWLEELDQPQHAATHYEQILALEPDHLEALTALIALLTQHESWNDVVALLRRKIDLTNEPEERSKSLLELAYLLETKVSLASEAIDVYSEALASDPADLRALESLERLYSLEARWSELVEILEQQADNIADGTLKVEKYLQISEIWEHRLEDAERAVEALRQALSLDPTCLDALRTLQTLLASQNRWAELLDVEHSMLEVVDDPKQKVEILRSIAGIEEAQLGNPYGATDALRRLIGLAPADADAVSILARIYQSNGDYAELAEVYLLHLDALTDDEETVRIRSALSDLYRGPIGEPVRAVELLLPVLEEYPDDGPTLGSLGSLYSELEDWASAVEMWGREIALLAPGHDAVERHYELGRIYLEKLDDLDSAEGCFKRALEGDPNHVESQKALKGVYEARGQWPEVISMLQMVEAAARDLPEKSEALSEIGRVYRDEMEDSSTANEYFQQAFDLAPDNVQAAESLVDVYWNESNWVRVEPILDSLIQNRPDADIRELQLLNFRLAKAAGELQNMEKSLFHYRQAYELDSTHLDTLRGLGELLLDRDELEQSFKICQTILVHHRDALSEAELAEIFCRQGDIKRQGEDERKALDFYRKALALEPGNIKVLKQLVDLQEAREDWEDVVHYRRRLVDLMNAGSERFEALLSVGDVLNEHLGNRRAAIEVYSQALEQEPGNRMVLGKLLSVHESDGNWDGAVDVLTQLAELEEEPERRAKYWVGVASIQQKYLDDRFTAVRSFDKALDADPGLLRAFEAIDQILTEDRDYARQDRYYRKMLKRATDYSLDDQLVFSLARNLGEINRTRLQQYSEAIKAYKIALSREPSHAPTHQILAQLYELNDEGDKAIGHYQRLIGLDFVNKDNYRSLKRLYYEAGDTDSEWCVTQALCVLQAANQEERVFYEKYRARTWRKGQRPLSGEHWKLLTHEQKNHRMDRVLARLFEKLRDRLCFAQRQLGLKKKHLLDMSQQTAFNDVANYLFDMVQTRATCFIDPQGRSGLTALNLETGPALLVGPNLLAQGRMQELAFMCAKSLYSLWPQHALVLMDTNYENRKQGVLQTMMTLVKMSNPSLNAPHDADMLTLLQQRLSPGDLAEFDKDIQRILESENNQIDVSAWLEGLEHSANRIGLLFCNDLEAAIRVINTHQPLSRASVKEQVQALISFSLTREYVELRKLLGFSVGR